MPTYLPSELAIELAAWGGHLFCPACENRFKKTPKQVQTSRVKLVTSGRGRWWALSLGAGGGRRRSTATSTTFSLVRRVQGVDGRCAGALGLLFWPASSEVSVWPPACQKAHTMSHTAAPGPAAADLRQWSLTKVTVRIIWHSVQ
jgi:hypothetical protein